jgi:RNA polymerase sigma-70 factor (ECF subfamily)
MDLSNLETEEQLRRAGNGDHGAISRLFGRYRNELCRVVSARLDRRVAARLEASDVVQQALGEASQRLPECLRERRVPLYCWLRLLTLLHLGWAHRFHLGSRKRSATRDVCLEAAPASGSPAAVLHKLRHHRAPKRFRTLLEDTAKGLTS